jgi:hypothetical protein
MVIIPGAGVEIMNCSHGIPDYALCDVCTWGDEEHCQCVRENDLVHTDKCTIHKVEHKMERTKFIHDVVNGGCKGVFNFTSETPPDTRVEATLNFWIHADDADKLVNEIKHIISRYNI